MAKGAFLAHALLSAQSTTITGLNRQRAGLIEQHVLLPKAMGGFVGISDKSGIRSGLNFYQELAFEQSPSAISSWDCLRTLAGIKGASPPLTPQAA